MLYLVCNAGIRQICSCHSYQYLTSTWWRMLNSVWITMIASCNSRHSYHRLLSHAPEVIVYWDWCSQRKLLPSLRFLSDAGATLTAAHSAWDHDTQTQTPPLWPFQTLRTETALFQIIFHREQTGYLSAHTKGHTHTHIRTHTKWHTHTHTHTHKRIHAHTQRTGASYFRCTPKDLPSPLTKTKQLQKSLIFNGTVFRVWFRWNVCSFLEQ